MGQAPHALILNKTLHASEAGHYQLNNRAAIGDSSGEKDVTIEAREEEGLAKGVEGYKDDASLNPIPGMIVQPWRDRELIASAPTDKDGFYRFWGLEPSLYPGREIVPEGWYALEAEEVELPLPSGETLQGGETPRADFGAQRHFFISGNK